MKRFYVEKHLWRAILYNRGDGSRVKAVGNNGSFNKTSPSDDVLMIQGIQTDMNDMAISRLLIGQLSFKLFFHWLKLISCS